MISIYLLLSRLSTSLLCTKKSFTTFLSLAGTLSVLSLTLYRVQIYRLLANFFAELDCISSHVSCLVSPVQGSNPLSLWLRPMFEHRRVQSVFGIGIILAITMFGFMSFIFPVRSNKVFAGFPSGSEITQEETVVVKPATELIISTERRYQIPVELIGVSQGYNTHHLGVDMRAPFGSSIKPVSPGIVRDVLRSNWGYGQAIIIDHENNVASMYAHVKNIFVDVGSNVDQNTIIAEVGLTGTTTGPHLHLEMYQKGAAVNPQPFLDY